MKHKKERAEMALKVLGNLEDALEILKNQRNHPEVNLIYRQVNRAFARGNKFWHEHVLNKKEKSYWYSKNWRPEVTD